MKLTSCLSNIKCIYSTCCNQEVFTHEIYLVNLISLLLTISLTIYFTCLIYNSKTKKDEQTKPKSENNLTFNKNPQFDYETNDSNFYALNVFSYLLLKNIIIHLIVMKLIELIFIQNLLIFGDSTENFSNDYMTFSNSWDNSIITITLLIHIVVLTFSFCILYIDAKFLDFLKKKMILFAIFSLFLLNNFIHSTSLYNVNHLNSYIYGMIIILLALKTINFNNLLLLKLNRENSTQEVNFHKDILNGYSKHLSEDDNELYKETNRVFDMYKVLEIVENIRMNRKQIWTVGLLFLFLILVLSCGFNLFMLYRNFKINYLVTPNLIKNYEIKDLFNLEYLNEPNIKNMTESIIAEKMENQRYSNNVLLVLLSNAEIDELNNNPEYNDFINKLTKDKSGKVYKVKSESNLNVPAWVSLFTGTKSNFNGVKGNIFKIFHLNKYDSIFKRMKRNKVNNIIIGKIVNLL